MPSVVCGVPMIVEVPEDIIYGEIVGIEVCRILGLMRYVSVLSFCQGLSGGE